MLTTLTDVEGSNATARDHAHAALHGSARAEGSPAGEHAPALDADGRRDGLCGNQIYGAFVLNHRVDLHAIDATPARWRGGVGSSPLDGASAPDALVDFHTE